MVRRKTSNLTGLRRIEGIDPHAAWVAFVCLKCAHLNLNKIGRSLIDPNLAFKSEAWPCEKCKYPHKKTTRLPFRNWPPGFRKSGSVHAQRFWLGFFRIATEHPSSYWKQCNACERVLPFAAFSKHTGWGPLSRQMECRSCKGAINAKLNPLRTAQQMHESSSRRRIADLLLEGENKSIDIKGLFRRFGSKCFKTGRTLNIEDRRSWAIDHILPSRYLYPLTENNAALLSVNANNAKRDRWPSDFYSNGELMKLANLTGANLELLSSTSPVVNTAIDVDACVSRYLKVRENSNLSKRIAELKKLLEDYELVGRLSPSNRRLLGIP